MAHARAEFDIPGITFGTRYDGSPLVVGDGSAPPADEPNRYVPSAAPGGRAPHAWLADGRSLFDNFGLDFSLLRLGPTARPADRIVETARRQGVPLRVIDVPSDEVRDAYQADLVLLRPDQMVAWRGDDLPGDVQSLVAVVTGH